VKREKSLRKVNGLTTGPRNQQGAPAGSGDDKPHSLNPYSPPQLKVFGPVGALTQAGSGTMSEKGMSMSAVMRL